MTKKSVSILPPYQRFNLWLIGNSPLTVFNHNQYERRKTVHVDFRERTVDEQYADAFCTMPSSKYPAPSSKGKYGVPTNRIRELAICAYRAIGLTDNTMTGLVTLRRSFWVMEDEGGLCLIRGKFNRDIQAFSIGSGVNTVSGIRHRPIWPEWRIKIVLVYDARTLNPEQLVNLFMHAGQYIGLCEMCTKKKQVVHGGFVVKTG